MRTITNDVTVKIDVGNMVNGQYAGLTHFSTKNYSTFGIKQENGERYLVYDYNGNSSKGIKITGKSVWFKSTWDYNGINRYFISIDSKSYQLFGDDSQLTWGSYRGDRIGIFNYNTKEDKGYVDIDWFHYDYSKD